MNQERMGKFIAELRKENNMTQDELAKKIPISRQAISKWERGISVPNSDTLLILSKLFKVSVNEILFGEKINNINKEKFEQISLKLYDNVTKKKKIIKCMCIIIILLVFSFLSYYFINSYKKIKVYSVSGESESYALNEGIFIKTNEKIYLRLGNIESSDDIKKLNLYYVENNNEKNLLVSTTNDFIQIVDFKNRNEFLNFKNINYIIKNMILEIENENGEIQTMKLHFMEDYVNDIRTLFSSNDNNYYIDNKLEQDEFSFSATNSQLNNDILELFNKNDEVYTYSLKIDEYKYNFSYDETSRLNIMTFKNNELIEELNFILEINYLSYNNSNNNIKFEIQNGDINCLNGDCKNYKEILEKYENLINTIK